MGLVNSTSLWSNRGFTGGKSLPVVGNGQYEVGCADIMVGANDEEDIGVFARIFYPTDSSPSAGNQTWRPRKEYVDGFANYKKISPRKIHFLLDLFVGDRRGSSALSFPIVVFSHGLSSCRLMSSLYCVSVASHGIVVAAIEHRDRSACWTYSLEKYGNGNDLYEKSIPLRQLTLLDNEFRVRNQQLHKRVAECVKLLSVLEEINLGFHNKQNSSILYGKDFDWTQLKVSYRRVAAVGHSFGGSTSTECHVATFQAAVLLDGWMFPIEKELYPRIQQPVLFLNADTFQWQENVKSMLQVGSEEPRKLIFTLRGITHYSFTDLPLVVPGFLSRKLNFSGETDAVTCLAAVVEMSVSFLRTSFEGDEFDSSEWEIFRRTGFRYLYGGDDRSYG
ncbi:unnamed protein product [Enterobius vermicularis]|uniref:1-alkyl-2-acetylglycerophosphocholine esterase n=1 Tax=Enterobius vermicularis TaxID=51028 RepID=A0A0N4UYX7_ENTVE|nr:unnamed protein product [Enterobius vermicularis]